MAGFKDFYQYASTTRVIAGRDLLGSTGLRVPEGGRARVLLVTDEVIRGTGLVEKVEAGVRDGGLELAGRLRRRARRTRRRTVCEQLRRGRRARPGADSFLAVGGGSVMDTAKVADAVFTHGGRAREQEGSS